MTSFASGDSGRDYRLPVVRGAGRATIASLKTPRLRAHTVITVLSAMATPGILHLGKERDMLETKNESPTHEQIEARAYEIYAQRGEGGHELEDWLKAEEELRQNASRRPLGSAPRTKSATSSR